MNPSRLKSRLGFQAKVLAPVVSVMVVLMTATTWLVNRRLDEQLREQAVEQLNTAANLFAQIQHNHANELKSKFRNIVNEPRFKAVTERTDFNTLSHFLEDTLQEFVNQEDASVATFTFIRESERRVISAHRDPYLGIEEFQSRGAAAIRRAAEGQPVADTIRVGPNVFEIAAFPIISEGKVSGVLTFGVDIGAEEASQIRQLTRSEIFILNDGRVSASSLPNREHYPQLARLFGTLSAEQTRLNADLNPALKLENRSFICRAGHFNSLSGDTGIGYLLLYEQPPAVLEAARQTRQVLLAVSLFGVILSSGIVWLVIRKITQPLRQLRDSAEAVGRGDLSRRVEVDSGDECGKLAEAFNRMTENLKTSRGELEKTVETLKATQHQLIQSEKLSGIGEFVAGVAHELNNPLTSVMGFAELLQQSDLPEQQRHYLQIMFKSSKRCQKIVQSLLTFARRHAPERKVVCVNEIVESTLEILNYQMRTSNIEAITKLDPRLPSSEVDPHQIQQVFLNIINNARQAIEAHQAGGWVCITTETVNGRVRITFQDNGPGIPPENLNRIFNPFFTTKEVGKGTGLGLSLCYGIISEHGGTITPRSEPGQGATFIVELPMASKTSRDAEAAAPAPSPPGARDGVGKRVLVIDDEDSILQMIREALVLHGYQVDVAPDGESALRRFRQQHYDLAVCDWKMPGLSGRQVYEELRAFDPEMSRRMIFITGDVANEKTQDFLRSQNKICLSKPFTLVEFRSAVKSLTN